MKYSKVSRRISRDEKFRKLSPPQPNGQSAFMHVLTNPHLTCIPGLFSAYDATLAKDLGWSTEALRDAIAEAIALDMLEVDWDAPLLWAPNAFDHNKPESLNVVKSWRPAFDDLPDCYLKHKALLALEAYMLGMGDGFRDTFQLVFADALEKARAIHEPEPEHEPEQTTHLSSLGSSNGALALAPPPAPKIDPVKTVWEFWKQDTNHPKAKLDPKRKARIAKRLSEGFAADQLCDAIRNRRNVPWLMGTDPKSQGTVYDGIETLLRDTAQVEKLLAATTAPNGAAHESPEAAERRSAWELRTITANARRGVYGDVVQAAAESGKFDPAVFRTAAQKKGLDLSL